MARALLSPAPMQHLGTRTKSPRRPRRPRRSRRGLTLIEILVVVTILGSIASLIGINVMGAWSGTQIDTTYIQMKTIDDALELYKVKRHAYPSTEQGLAALTVPDAHDVAALKELPLDAWDRSFIYVSPSQHGKGRYDLASAGPDGVHDTDDDITSWKPRRYNQ